jgi:hypothetical protein
VPFERVLPTPLFDLFRPSRLRAAITSAAVLLLTSGLWSCAGTGQPQDLLRGDTLRGWQPVGDVEWRRVAGDVVAAGSGDGFLMTSHHHANFELSLEFWVDRRTNSGVFIRCQDRSRIHPDTCYEFNIWDEHPQQEARTGAIVFRVMPPLARVNTIGQWNSYRIVADGKRLAAWVNGVLTAELQEADLDSGFIALQHWGEGEVRFRNIRLQTLD